MEIFAVIPAYDAEKTIESVFKRAHSADLPKISKFVVVNDGSMDGTEKVLEKLEKTYRIVVLRHERNMGYGMAQKTGYRYALENGADAVVLLHADGQYPPEMMGRITQPIIDGEADVVCGWRKLGMEALRAGMPLHKMAGNYILTKIQNLVLRACFASYHCGYRVYSRVALEKIQFEALSNYFDFDTEMLICSKIADMRIVEVRVPVCYGEEKSYLNSVRYGFRILSVLWKYLTRKYLAYIR